MIYLEIITLIIILVVMIYMSAISTAYLATSKEELALNEIKDKEKIKRLKYIMKNSSVLVSSVTSGVSFLNLWLGALIVEIVAAPIYKKYSFVFLGTNYLFKYVVILFVTLIFTYLLYIFADTMPKAYAIKHRKKIVLSSINFLYYISKIFSPITKLTSKTEELIMRMFKVDRKAKIEYSDSEVREVVELAKEQGNLNRYESEILSNFLKLDKITAKDIMKDMEEVAVLDLNSNKEQIKNVILNYGYTRIPICDTDKRNIVGIINVKNVLKNMLEEKSTKKLDATKYVKPCMKVSSGKRIDLLFNEMKANKEHIAIVTKEKNIAIGIITMEDIIETMVGNIEDDFEKYK